MFKLNKNFHDHTSFISGHHSINPSREAISIPFGKDKRFTFVHPVMVIQCKTISNRPSNSNNRYIDVQLSKLLDCF